MMAFLQNKLNHIFWFFLIFALSLSLLVCVVMENNILFRILLLFDAEESRDQKSVFGFSKKTHL